MDLIEASRDGQLDLVKLLLERGGNVNIQDIYGDTALIWASLYGHLDIVKLLLEKGADVNIQDNYGTVSYTHLTLPTILLV